MEADLDEKYNPFVILGKLWGRFGKTYEGYAVFIEITTSPGECYRLQFQQNFGPISKAPCHAESWREIRKADILAKEKDALGKVHIRYKDEPLKIGGVQVGPFEGYNDFWLYLNS